MVPKTSVINQPILAIHNSHVFEKWINAGTPWTEEEHKMFLVGLQELGKGDWRGIARNYVVSRTPTQVASHAQKYFLRQSNVSRRKRRSSLFDMIPDRVITFSISPTTRNQKEKAPPLFFLFLNLLLFFDWYALVNWFVRGILVGLGSTSKWVRY